MTKHRKPKAQPRPRKPRVTAATVAESVEPPYERSFLDGPIADAAELFRALNFSEEVRSDQRKAASRAKAVHARLLELAESAVPVEAIQALAAEAHGIEKRELLARAPSPDARIAQDRAIALAVELTGLPLSRIAKRFGGMSVMAAGHAHARVERLYESGRDDTRLRIENLSSALQARHAKHGVDFVPLTDYIFVARTAIRDAIEWIEREYIGREPTGEKPTGTVAERFAKLDQYVKDHPEKSVSECVLSLIPELEMFTQERVPLPKKAPALWAKDKREGETPPDFVKRHYAPWLGKGLGQVHIKALDERLYMALYNWLRNHEMPADLDLPTLKQRNDRLLEALRGLGLDSDELQRISAATQRRA